MTLLILILVDALQPGRSAIPATRAREELSMKALRPNRTPFSRRPSHYYRSGRLTCSKSAPLTATESRGEQSSTGIYILKKADLAAARQAQPSLLIVRWPTMGGVALCHAIRADAVLSRTPVLLVCDEAIPIREMLVALEAGADDYLTLPCEMEDFVTKLAQLMPAPATPAEMLAAQQEVHELSAKLESVREEERIRVAREVHDELGQLLTGLKMDVAWARRHLNQGPGAELAHIAQRLAAMSGLIDETVNCVRRIAADLRPPMLDDIGLLAALEWQTGEFAARAGIECRVFETPAAISLNAQQGTAVFRIFKEALTNIARHADATQVEIRLKQTPTTFSLSVRDNGRGCPPEKFYAGNSLGLLGMRERAAMLGGVIKLWSQPDAGTLIEVSLPL